jgi:DNA invertase Pin-like site-specific DNA recombinase
MKAAGYGRVSTVRQKVVGMSLEAQQTAVRAAIDGRAWSYGGWFTESRSASRRRPELERARCWAREHQGALVVARFDRAWRSPLEFYLDMDRAQREGWAIVLLQPAVDLTEPFGEAMAGMSAVFARFEQRLISLRTREAIAARKEAGIYKGGVLLPQAQPVDGRALRRITQLLERDMTDREIARRLDLEGVPTPRGGEAWSYSTVGVVRRRIRAGREGSGT